MITGYLILLRADDAFLAWPEYYISYLVLTCYTLKMLPINAHYFTNQWCWHPLTNWSCRYYPSNHMAHAGIWSKVLPILWILLLYYTFLIPWRFRLIRVKRLTEKYFLENDLRKNIFRKMFYEFEIRKTFYRKMSWFSVDQENIFRWPLIFRETNTRKSEKYFSVNHF